MADPVTRANQLLEKASHAAPVAAARLADEAYRLVCKALGTSDPNAAVVLSLRGHYRDQSGDQAGAARDYARAAERLTPHLGDPEACATQVQSLRALGNLRRNQGRYPAAEAALKQALAVAEKHLGSNHLETGLTLNVFGMLCKYSGRFADGRRAYDRALRILKAADPKSVEVADVYHNLGGLEHERGRFDVAEPFGRRAVTLRSAALGKDHPHTAADLAAWAAILAGLGRERQAEQILVDVIAIFERSGDHYEVAVNLHNLAALRARRGRSKEAAQLYRRALALKVRALGARHPDVALTLYNLARLPGEPQARLLRRALAIWQRVVGPRHPDSRACAEALAKLSVKRSRARVSSEKAETVSA